MTEPLLEVRRLVKHFGAVVATAALDLAIMPGELHAVIGPNGAGKTTLIGQLAGEVPPDAGHIYSRDAISQRCRCPDAPLWDWHVPSKAPVFFPAFRRCRTWRWPYKPTQGTAFASGVRHAP